MKIHNTSPSRYSSVYLFIATSKIFLCLCLNLYPLLYVFFHEVSLPYFFGLLNFWTFLLKMAFSVKGLSKRFFPRGSWRAWLQRSNRLNVGRSTGTSWHRTYPISLSTWSQLKSKVSNTKPSRKKHRIPNIFWSINFILKK